MKVEIGDKFIKDTKYGRISYEVIDVQLCGVGSIIVYKGQCDNEWKKSGQNFRNVIKRFNARRIPKNSLDLQSYIPRHNFKSPLFNQQVPKC